MECNDLLDATQRAFGVAEAVLRQARVHAVTAQAMGDNGAARLLQAIEEALPQLG